MRDCKFATLSRHEYYGIRIIPVSLTVALVYAGAHLNRTNKILKHRTSLNTYAVTLGQALARHKNIIVNHHLATRVGRVIPRDA